MNKTILLAVLATLAIAVVAIPNRGLAQDDDSKGIRAEVFLKARPAKKAKSTARYHAKSSTGSAESFANAAQVGITIWRFRKSTATDRTKELVEEEDGGPTEWTLERVEEGTLLAPGQRVRLSIESLTRNGYVYVVDREQYADGSFGEPVLIFPTQKTNAANKVGPGRLIYIPSATGRFIIKPSASTKPQVAEVLTIIVAPSSLISNDELALKAIHLKRETFDSWVKQWEANSKKFEMDGGAGQAMTPTEQLAASTSAALLNQDDPVPQTIFQLAAKPDKPLLITVPLKFVR